MKQEFSVIERILLLSVLPREGNFQTLKILRELRENLSFSETENAALQFREQKSDDGRLSSIVWNEPQAAALVKGIDVGPMACAAIKQAVLELDGKNKLTEQWFSLYERFVEPEAKVGAA